MNTELLLYAGVAALVLFVLWFFLFRKKSRRQTAAYLDSRAERRYVRPSRAVVDDDDDFDLGDGLADGLSDAVSSTRQRPAGFAVPSSQASERRTRHPGSVVDGGADDSFVASSLAMQSAHSAPLGRHANVRPHDADHRSDDAPAKVNGYDSGHQGTRHHTDHSSHDTGGYSGGDSGGDGGGGGGGGD